jgi:hypothetical protein
MRDGELAEMAASPLLPGLIADVYRGRTADDIVAAATASATRREAAGADGSPAPNSRRAKLFDAYLEYAFRRNDHLAERAGLGAPPNR